MKRTILCFVVIFVFTTKSFSQYADLGTGALKNQIWWFDWNGFTLSNGASRSFTTGDGLNVTITFSNIQGPVFQPWIMNTWYGSVLHFLYDFSNPNIKPALFSPYTTLNSQFTINVTATRNGIPTPFKFIAADAEASALSEITTLTTNGTGWECIDFFRNSTQTSNPFGGCTTQTATITDTYAGSSGIGQNPVIATDNAVGGPLVINCNFNRSGVDGQMGIAFGIFGSVDMGDLPASYGNAQHTLKYTTSNPCNYLPPLPATSLVQNLKIGTVAGDADPILTSDDNANGADEDGITTFPSYNGGGSYSLAVPVTNTTGTTAYLTGWFDYNRNGVFDNNEYVTAFLNNNATTATLTWNGLPVILPVGAVNDWAFRFRLSSNLAATLNSSGYAPDGEVEDYITNALRTNSADFVVPDTVCVNTPISINNTSTNASSFYWNFCSGSLNTQPAGTNFTSPNISSPVFMDLVQDGLNYYVFVVNHTGSLSRMDFGNSLLNPPTITNLGSFGGIIPFQAEGIEIQKDGNVWIGYLIGGQFANSRLVKFNFGTSLSNTPTASNLGNIGGLDFPVDFSLYKDGTTWYGFTVNASNNSVTRFTFGNSLANTPVATNLGNIGGLNYPEGIFLIKNGNSFHLFVTNRNSNGLSRLDFGASLANTPTGVNLGNPGNNLSQPRDITVIRDCDRIFGFITNEGTNHITRLDFNNDMLSVPTTFDIGNIGSLAYPHSISEIFRTGDAVNFFIANVSSNSISRITFNNCTSASIPSYSGTTPPPFQYNQPGEYNISLFADDGLATQTVICKKIVVVPPPFITLGSDAGFCPNAFIILGQSLPQGVSYSWSNGLTTPTITVQQPGSYSVSITNQYGCSAKDTIDVVAYPSPQITIAPANDTVICKNTAFTATATGGVNYTWSNSQSGPSINVSAPGTYVVTGTAANGCKNTDTLHVTEFTLPVSASNDTTLCSGQQIQLQASGGTIFNWSPSTGLNDPAIPNPIANATGNITYYVTVTDANHCSNMDSVKLTVRSAQFGVNPAISICPNKTAQLTASGGDIYSWLPATALSDALVANPTATPQITTTYSVSITDTVCHQSTLLSTVVNVLQLPNVKAIKANDIDCSRNYSQLIATGAQTYLWSPASTLNNAAIANPTATPAGGTMYTVKGTDGFGCVNYDSVRVEFVSADTSAYYMPNAFTPNGDGLNDCYGIKFWGVINELEFGIYNRWGERIFFTKNPNDCWDGIYKGKKQDIGVYVYMIKAKTYCGDTFKKGLFTLIR
jgi:gliding motility-associated-like protein